MSGDIEVYDAASGAGLGSLRGHDGAVWGIEDYPTEESSAHRAVSVSQDSTVRVWDMEEYTCLGLLIADIGPLTALLGEFKHVHRIAVTAGSTDPL